MLARRLQRPGFFYGWIIVLVSFLIIAFVFGQKGLMAGLTIEGSKITRLEK